MDYDLGEARLMQSVTFPRERSDIAYERERERLLADGSRWHDVHKSLLQIRKVQREKCIELEQG
jgi:hypothetical protein